MKEFLDPIWEHPPFNFAMNPDLGGTAYDYVKEVSRDKIIYFVRDRSSLTKLEIPGDKSFFHISIENLSSGGVFSEAFYDYMGELTSANIWFARFCDQADFMERAQPDDDILDAYDQLFEERTDIMLQANLAFGQLSIFRCTEDSTSDNLNALSASSIELPSGEVFLRFPPVTFRVISEPEILSLGFRVNNGNVANDRFSTSVKFDKLYGKTTPGGVKEILRDVFVKY